MGNKYVILAFSAVLTLPSFLGAQNLDPTVEVTREYEGKLMETHKPSLEMAVPDSVMHFALDFDYSVFENPYKGSYDFNPYLLSMRPSSTDRGEKDLYLRAGIGYQLKPEVDFVWSPGFRNKGFNMDVYALHRSFLGNYWNILPVEYPDGEVALQRKGNDEGGKTWAGIDLLTKAGVDCRYDAAGLAVDFGAGYYGLYQKDRAWKRGFNALDLRLGFATKPETAQSTVYDVKAAYRFGQDRLNGTAGLSEHIFDFDLAFGPVLTGAHRLRFDLGVDMASYSKVFVSAIGEVSVVPHYVFGKDRLHLDVGLRLAKLIRSKEMSGMFAAKEQIVYPDVTFSYALLPQSLKFYLAAKGGNTIDTYSSIIERNHHVTYASAPALLDCTVEKVRTYAGFDGRISSVFSYNVKGGYVYYGNAMLDAVALDAVPDASVRYAPYQKWFAAIDWLLKTERVRLDGSLSYDHAWGELFDTGYVGVAVLKPAALTGDVSFEYNWNRRVFAGVDCSFSTARKGGFGMPGLGSDQVPLSMLKVPGYADLGFFAEYATARGLAFWVRAGNLLNMTVQRNPLYAERGVNFTLGICLSL